MYAHNVAQRTNPPPRLNKQLKKSVENIKNIFMIDILTQHLNVFVIENVSERSSTFIFESYTRSTSRQNGCNFKYHKCFNLVPLPSCKI